MADFDPSEPNFDDEDNNPFPHQGIASLMSQSHASTPNSGPGPDPTASGNPPDDDDDGSILLYNATSKSSDARSATGAKGSSVNGINELGDLFHTVQINFESRVSKLLKTPGEAKIQITEAGNSNEGMNNSSKKYIVYTIKLINVNDANEEIQTRRRYSDFVSLREVLTKIFPLVIIPPIPPKNYMNMNVLNGFGAQGLGSAGGSGGGSNGGANSSSGSGSGSAPSGVNAALNIHGAATYSYINSTHLAKSRLIEHRKRLLTNFLNNCLEINQIRSLEFFSKFLDPSSNWSDEVSLISNQLPKSVYQSNPENGLRTEAIYASLPNPSSGHMGFLKDNKKKLTNKLLYNRHDTEATGGLAVTEPTPPTQASEETDYILNTSSLDDINKKIMENYIGLSSDYTELGTIFNSFSLVLADTTSRDLKKGSPEDEVKLHIIFDKIGQVFDRSYITINSLIGDLETKFSEPLGEAVQFSNILQHIARFQQKKLRQKQLVDADIKIKRGDLEELLRLEGKNGESVKVPTKAKPDPGKSKFKMFSIKKITQYVSDIMDQNPDQTRKQKIGYLQTKIKTLESCQNIMLQDISYIADEINKNFKLFHSKQLRAIYEILLSYYRFLITWAKKNIDIWEEVRDEVYKL